MSVRRCQDEIDSAEFSEWMAYDQIDPIGAEREDLRMGILASTVVHAQHPKARCCPADFMPKFDATAGSRRKQGQTIEDMQAMCRLASGGKKKGGK